jgi:hypothetical protein
MAKTSPHANFSSSCRQLIDERARDIKVLMESTAELAARLSASQQYISVLEQEIDELRSFKQTGGADAEGDREDDAGEQPFDAGFVRQLQVRAYLVFISRELAMCQLGLLVRLGGVVC